MERKTPAIRFLLPALLAVVLPLCAADFWKTKPHSEWTNEEMLKILTDSPWAKSVEIPVESMATIVRSPRYIPPGPYRRGGIYPGGTAVRLPRTADVHLRWISALPVYEAMARSRFGDAPGKRPPARFRRLREEPFHVLEVDGVPRALLEGQLDELKLRTSLKIKGLDPIHPRQVRGEPAGKTGSIRFAFPKDEGGGHTINMDDREVEFQLKLEKTTIKKKFNLKDMVYQDRFEI